MSIWFIIVVVVAAVVAVRWMNRRQAEAEWHDIPDATMDRAEPGETLSDTEAEIAALRERIAVLERIATEENSAEAAERRRIDREIDRLRDEE